MLVQRPFEDEAPAAIRRSNESGLPFGAGVWVRRLSKKQELDLTVRARGRLRQRSELRDDDS